jgi:hypothetical protein
VDEAVRFQETLRRLAMIDEGFVEDQASLGLGMAGTSAFDPRTAALLQVAALVAGGASGACVEWSAARALWANSTTAFTAKQRGRPGRTGSGHPEDPAAHTTVAHREGRAHWPRPPDPGWH